MKTMGMEGKASLRGEWNSTKRSSLYKRGVVLAAGMDAGVLYEYSR